MWLNQAFMCGDACVSGLLLIHYECIIKWVVVVGRTKGWTRPFYAVIVLVVFEVMEKALSSWQAENMSVSGVGCFQRLEVTLPHIILSLSLSLFHSISLSRSLFSHIPYLSLSFPLQTLDCHVHWQTGPSGVFGAWQNSEGQLYMSGFLLELCFCCSGIDQIGQTCKLCSSFIWIT